MWALRNIPGNDNGNKGRMCFLLLFTSRSKFKKLFSSANFTLEYNWKECSYSWFFRMSVPLKSTLLFIISLFYKISQQLYLKSAFSNMYYKLNQIIFSHVIDMYLQTMVEYELKNMIDNYSLLWLCLLNPKCSILVLRLYPSCNMFW